MPLRYVGTIVSAAGGNTTNATTAAPFIVMPRSRILIQPDAIASVMTGVAVATAGTAVTLAANEKYVTVLNAGNTVLIGTTASGQIALVGPAAFNAKIFEESGDTA